MQYILKICLFMFCLSSQILHAKNLNFTFYPQTSDQKKRPPIVLIHGLRSSQETWNRVIKGLQEVGDVWAIDLPGYGKSSELPHKTLKEVQEALRQFMQDSKIKSPILIAHSMGAQLAVLSHDILKPSFFIIEDIDMQERSAPSKKNSVDDFYRFYVSSNKDVKFAWKKLPLDLPILVLQAQSNSAMSKKGIDFMKSNHKIAEVIKIPNSHHSIHNSQPERFLSAVKTSQGLAPCAR